MRCGNLEGVAKFRKLSPLKICNIEEWFNSRSGYFGEVFDQQQVQIVKYSSIIKPYPAHPTYTTVQAGDDVQGRNSIDLIVFSFFLNAGLKKWFDFLFVCVVMFNDEIAYARVRKIAVIKYPQMQAGALLLFIDWFHKKTKTKSRVRTFANNWNFPQ